MLCHDPFAKSRGHNIEYVLRRMSLGRGMVSWCSLRNNRQLIVETAEQQIVRDHEKAIFDYGRTVILVCLQR